MPSGAPAPSRPWCRPRYAALDGDAFPGIWRVRDSWISRRPTATPSGSWNYESRSADRPALRRDFLVRATEDIADASPGLSVEVARWLSERVALSLGGSFSRHEPSGTTLDSGMIGRIQPKLVAPELAFHAAASRAYAASATVLARLAQGATLVVRGRFDGSRPVDSVPGVGAERSLWSVSAGMAWVATASRPKRAIQFGTCLCTSASFRESRRDRGGVRWRAHGSGELVLLVQISRFLLLTAITPVCRPDPQPVHRRG